MNLVFIGNKFYIKSGTTMSSIYEIDSDGNIINRSDWGKVQKTLSNKEPVHIYPANDAQMVWAYKMLEELEKII